MPALYCPSSRWPAGASGWAGPAAAAGFVEDCIPVVSVEAGRAAALGLEVFGQVNIPPGQNRHVAQELRHGGIDLLRTTQIFLLFSGYLQY